MKFIETLEKYKGEDAKAKQARQSIGYHYKEFVKFKTANPTKTYDDYIATRTKLGMKAASLHKPDVLQVVAHFSGTPSKVERTENTASVVSQEEVDALFQELLRSQEARVPIVKFKGELDAKGKRIFESPLFKQKMVDYQKSRAAAAIKAREEAAAKAREVVAGPKPKDVGPEANEVFPSLVGYCPIGNPSNWCYLNASIQMLNDIPELKQSLLALTNEEITASDKVYTEEQPLALIQKAIKILKTVYDTITKNANRDPISFSTVEVNLPPKTGVYRAFIDLVRVSDEVAADLHRAREEKKPVAQRRPFDYPFVYGQQSDADEFLFRIFTFLFSSNLSSLRILKYLFTYERFENIVCVDKTKGENGRIESNVILDSSFDINLVKGYTQEGNPIYVTSIQDAIDTAQVPEVLVEGENMLEACGDGKGSKAKASQKGLQYRIFPFTKYLFVKVKRLVGDDYYLGKVIVNTKLTINGVNYQPRGVIYHSGSRKGGHYIYYHFENGEPSIVCNDSSVYPIPKRNRLSEMSKINGDGRGGARAILYERIGPVNQELVSKVQTAEESVLASQKKDYLEKEAARKGAKTANNIKKKNEEKLKSAQTISTELRKAIKALVGVEPKAAVADPALAELEAMRDALLDELESQFASEAGSNSKSNNASSVSSSSSVDLEPQADSNEENSDSEIDPVSEGLLTELANLGVNIGKLDDYTIPALEKRLKEEKAKQAAPTSPRSLAAIVKAVANNNEYAGGKRKSRKHRKVSKRQTRKH